MKVIKGVVAIIVMFGCIFWFDHTALAADILIENIPREINITLNETPIPYTDIYVGNANGFKSYMGYSAITKKSSPQYMLQQLCGTDVDGFRKCADRYVIAVGHGVGGQVGDCVDLMLENGQVIYCVIGDYKANKHTDISNLIGKNGCCSEFIVDTKLLRKDIKFRGDIGCGYLGWESPVVLIRRYNINYLTMNLLGGTK